MKHLGLFFLFGVLLAFSLVHCSGGGSGDTSSSEDTTEETSDSGSSAPEPQDEAPMVEEGSDEMPAVEESDTVPAAEAESEEDLSGQSEQGEQGDQVLEEEVSELPEEAADESSPEGDTETAEEAEAADIETKTVAEVEEENSDAQEEEESADAAMAEEAEGDAATDDEDSEDSEDSDTLSDDDFAEGEESSVSVDADDLAQSLEDEEEAPEPSPQSCSPGDTSACYSGPEGTAGVGVCKAGFSSCSDTGTVGECVFSVTPQTEDCLTKDDEDCNGVAEACDALCPAEQTIDLALGDSKTVSASTVGNPDQYAGSCGGAGTSDTVVAFRTKEQGTLKITVTPEPGATVTPILYLSEGCSDAAELCKTGNSLAVKTDPYEVTHRLFIDGGQGKFSVVATVSPEVCGDGAQNYGEQCDDGNTASGDGCSACVLDCGNGIVENAEECDDRNNTPTDGCDQCKSVSYYVDDYKNFCSVPDPNETTNESSQKSKAQSGTGKSYEEILEPYQEESNPSQKRARGYGIHLVVNGQTLEIHVNYELIYPDYLLHSSQNSSCDGTYPTTEEIQEDITRIKNAIQKAWEGKFTFCMNTYQVDVIFDHIIVRNYNQPPTVNYNQMYLWFCQGYEMPSRNKFPRQPFSGEWIHATSMDLNAEGEFSQGWANLGHEFGHAMGFAHDQKQGSEYKDGVLMGSGTYRKAEYLAQLLTRKFKACKLEFDTDVMVNVAGENEDGSSFLGTYDAYNLATDVAYVAGLVEWNEFNADEVNNWEFIPDQLENYTNPNFSEEELPPQEVYRVYAHPGDPGTEPPGGDFSRVCEADFPPDPDRSPIVRCAWERYDDVTLEAGNTLEMTEATQLHPDEANSSFSLYPRGFAGAGSENIAVNFGICPSIEFPYQIVAYAADGGKYLFLQGSEIEYALYKDLYLDANYNNTYCSDPSKYIDLFCYSGDCQRRYTFTGTDKVKNITIQMTAKDGSLVPIEEANSYAQ